MELELATFEDIIRELRRRAVHFVFVGVEPTNGTTATVHIGAFGTNDRQIKRLLDCGDRELGKPTENNGDSLTDPEA